jgi:predicted secreted protein
MVSSAFWAFGTALQLGDGATSETFTSIAELTEIQPPQMTKESYDVTNHSSTNRFRERIPGLKDGGSLSFKANWLPNNATHDESTGLWECYKDNVNHNWRLVLPDSLGTVSFAGHLTALSPETPLAGQGTLSGTIVVSGEPTWS